MKCKGGVPCKIFVHGCDLSDFNILTLAISSPDMYHTSDTNYKQKIHHFTQNRCFYANLFRINPIHVNDALIHDETSFATPKFVKNGPFTGRLNRFFFLEGIGGVPPVGKNLVNPPPIRHLSPFSDQSLSPT